MTPDLSNLAIDPIQVRRDGDDFLVVILRYPLTIRLSAIELKALISAAQQQGDTMTDTTPTPQLFVGYDYEVNSEYDSDWYFVETVAHAQVIADDWYNSVWFKEVADAISQSDDDSWARIYLGRVIIPDNINLDEDMVPWDYDPVLTTIYEVNSDD